MSDINSLSAFAQYASELLENTDAYGNWVHKVNPVQNADNQVDDEITSSDSSNAVEDLGLITD